MKEQSAKMYTEEHGKELAALKATQLANSLWNKTSVAAEATYVEECRRLEAVLAEASQSEGCNLLRASRAKDNIGVVKKDMWMQ